MLQIRTELFRKSITNSFAIPSKAYERILGRSKNQTQTETSSNRPRSGAASRPRRGKHRPDISFAAATIWKGRLKIPKSHSTMLLVCLHYLLLPDLAIPVQNSPSGQERSFLPYAAAHWPLYHISQEHVITDKPRKDTRTLCNSVREARVWAPSYFESYHHWESWTDLALASYLGLKLTIEDILIKEKTDFNAQAGCYGTALQAASSQGRKKIVEILLNRGADVNAEDGHYGTALQAASSQGHREIVESLLDHHAE